MFWVRSICGWSAQLTISMMWPRAGPVQSIKEIRWQKRNGGFMTQLRKPGMCKDCKYFYREKLVYGMNRLKVVRLWCMKDSEHLVFADYCCDEFEEKLKKEGG